MVEWEVAVALGASGLTFVLWTITTYLTFLRNRPKLVVKAPRYVFMTDVWDIYIYNEGTRATRMLEQYTHLFLRKGRLKVNIVGDFRPQNRVDYFNASPGAFHHFYIEYQKNRQFKDKKMVKEIQKLQLGMKAKMLLVIKYDNGRRTKVYKKKIKLDQEDANRFLRVKTLEEKKKS